MDMSRFAGVEFIRFDSVRNGPLRKKIAKFGIGKRFDKPQITFTDDSVLSLSATNVRTLIGSYGKDGRGWVGVEVELFAGTTRFEGTTRDSVLIRPISPPRAANEPLPPEPGSGDRDDMDDEIPY
jgi:hypothetical protein